ncbi:MarR family transcriptional regulator [Rugosibacter aromaticivorans]|uniref:MarR family transcriptional regulator n=1 Tax=Rugosibacter aromaticivorans TaxID=1565605 RepID=A0A0C5JKH9_9PROT|nr:MarR family transcriptional regulator [Rugosibacter aromaticivorans]AJP47891.1 MarR family transcriptional regulator [Rugosibacter aromaticivorans]TBR15026.1 MAG: MarR family transcriptional regulator [Rugosibacter sp.]
MPQTTFRSTLRELVRCYQAFEGYASSHIHQQGLTISQFDILVTLGNGQGMTPKELVEQTWITKGTLTGVVDRLQLKGLVKRTPSTLDGRSQIITLTKKGQKLFEKVFPEHLAYMGQAFAHLQAKEISHVEEVLGNLRHAFELQKNKEGNL